MKLNRLIAAGVVTGMVCAATAGADTIVVNVFSFDYSASPPGEPILDPTINVGDTIQWVFLGPFHTATSVAGIPEQFDSGIILEIGATFEHTFTNLGTWHYYCTPHGIDNGDGTASGMAGTITVVPAPASAGVLALGAAAALRRRRRS